MIVPWAWIATILQVGSRHLVFVSSKVPALRCNLLPSAKVFSLQSGSPSALLQVLGSIHFNRVEVSMGEEAIGGVQRDGGKFMRNRYLEKNPV